MSRLISYSFCLLVAGLVFYAFSHRGAEPVEQASLNVKKVQINDMIELDGRLVAVGERGTIVISENNGKTWKTTHGDAQVPVTLTDISSLSDGVLMAVGHDSVILRSDDDGLTWKQIMRDSERGEPLMGSWSQDGKTVFAFGSFGKFLVSDDGGKSFKSQELPGRSYHFSSMAGNEQGVRILVGERGTAMRSQDGGETWEQQESFYKGSLFGVAHLEDSRWVTYGMRGHIFYSDDNGDHWNEIKVPNELPLYGHSLVDGGKKMVMVGTAGSYVTINDRGELLETGTLGDLGTLTSAVTLPDGKLFVAGQSGLAQGFQHPIVADHN